MSTNDYQVSGNVVERLAPPRCRSVLIEQPDGSWRCENTDWIDPPPTDAKLAARIMREIGDAWLAHHQAG